jgi:hypothetical protein
VPPQTAQRYEAVGLSYTHAVPAAVQVLPAQQVWPAAPQVMQRYEEVVLS